RPLERFEEFELDANEIAGPALGDRHSPFAHLRIADPRIDLPDTGRRSLIGLLHRRIDFPPRVPGLPAVQVVDVREDGRRRGGHGRRARDAEIRRLQRHDDEKDDEHRSYANGYVEIHGCIPAEACRLPRYCSLCLSFTFPAPTSTTAFMLVKP